MSSRIESIHTNVATGALPGALAAVLRGEVIDPAHAEYETARRVWNGLIDRYPAVIARCADVGDVVRAVRLAREHRPVLSIRGGGHQIAGSAVCDDGMVIDLSAMKAIEVDPEARTVRAQAGVTWGELDRATQSFGLATPGGEVSTTGIAGFTLGGGMGLVMRALGLACDNLRAVDIVTADGQVRTASAEENADLFWAIRGGGRGIGVVTTFEFALHPLGPDVAVAQVFYPYDEARRILQAWPTLVRSMLDSVSPDPSIPPELHGQPVVIVNGLFAGPAANGMAVLEPLRTITTPLFETSGIIAYLEVQSSVDALFPAGGRYYMKSHFLDELSEPAIDALLEWDGRRPTPESLIVLRSLGGAVDRVPPEGSAYPHRSATFNLSIDAGWSDPALDAAGIGWARHTWDALRPVATGGVYVNFSGLDDEATDLRTAVYGASARRLAAVRAARDPEGLFAGAAARP